MSGRLTQLKTSLVKTFFPCTAPELVASPAIKRRPRVEKPADPGRTHDSPQSPFPCWPRGAGRGHHPPPKTLAAGLQTLERHAQQVPAPKGEVREVESLKWR